MGLETTTSEATTTYEYDPLYGKLFRTYDMNNNYVAYNYDTQGNLIEISKWDAKGSATETDDERLSITQYNYQHPTYPGMLYREINYDGTYTEYDYDDAGNIVTVVDPKGRITTNIYDNLNRLISTTESGSIITDRDYDTHGNLNLFIDPGGSQTTFTYDDMGRVVSTISPDSGTTLASYDGAGNRKSKTDGNNITVQYQYDVLGRIENIIFPDPAQNIFFSYDQGINGKGKRTGMTDPTGSTTWEYDDQGRAFSKTTTVNGVAYTISRAFTPGGDTNSFTYPDGRTVNFTRDAQNKIIQLTTTQSSGTKILLDNLQYRPFGGVSSMTNGAGVTVESQYSACGCGVGVVSAGNPLERQYSYDSNKNVTGLSYTNYPGLSVTYDYDDQDRLVEYDGPQGRILYSYDLVGNRLGREIRQNVKNEDVEPKLETYSYTSSTNKVSSIVITSDGTNYNTTTNQLTYDNAGNITNNKTTRNSRQYIITIGNRVMVYNQNNRLSQVLEGATVLGEYTYNGLEQRVQKTVDGTTTLFLYDFNGNLIAEAMPDGTLTREYIYSGSSRLAMVDVATGIVLHYVNDKLGTPQSLVDENNTPVWSAKYLPFGEVAIDANPIVEQNFRFPGQYYDSETGLHYNWHRYYDPSTGRYLRPDPIGFEGGINLYHYANANPIRFIDPKGLSSECPDCPGGTWDLGGGVGGEIGLFRGRSRNRITFTCKSSGKKCRGVLACEYSGIFFSLGLNYTFYTTDPIGTGSLIHGYPDSSQLKDYTSEGISYGGAYLSATENTISPGVGYNIGRAKYKCRIKTITCN